MKLDDLYIQALGSWLPQQRMTLTEAQDEGYDSDDLASEVLEAQEDYETVCIAGETAPADMAVES